MSINVELPENSPLVKEFLERTGLFFEKRFIGRMTYFHDDTQPRNVWEIKAYHSKRGYGHDFVFKYQFGDSLTNTYGQYVRPRTVWEQEQQQNFLSRKPIPPTDYTLLCCMSSDSCFDSEDEWDFAKEFGYEIKDKESYHRVLGTFLKCKEMYEWITRIFSEEDLEYLRENFQ